MKLTRRAFTNATAASAAALVTAPSARPQQPAAADAALSNARAQVQSSSKDLAAVKLPRSVEPVTRFEA